VDDKVFKTTHSAVHLPPLITSKQKTFRLPLLALTTLNSPENPTQADPSVSVQHFIDPVSGVVITTGYGRVTFQETLDSISTLRQNSLFRPTLPHLEGPVRHSQVRVHTAGHLRPATNSRPIHQRPPGRAGGYRSGLALRPFLFRALAGNPNLGLFSSLPDALSWLDLGATVLPGYASRVSST